MEAIYKNIYKDDFIDINKRFLNGLIEDNNSWSDSSKEGFYFMIAIMTDIIKYTARNNLTGIALQLNRRRPTRALITVRIKHSFDARARKAPTGLHCSNVASRTGEGPDHPEAFHREPARALFASHLNIEDQRGL
jgi:hypothetical protein